MLLEDLRKLLRPEVTLYLYMSVIMAKSDSRVSNSFKTLGRTRSECDSSDPAQPAVVPLGGMNILLVPL